MTTRTQVLDDLYASMRVHGYVDLTTDDLGKIPRLRHRAEEDGLRVSRYTQRATDRWARSRPRPMRVYLVAADGQTIVRPGNQCAFNCCDRKEGHPGKHSMRCYNFIDNQRCVEPIGHRGVHTPGSRVTPSEWGWYFENVQGD